jgi:hypothetical protein
MRYEIHREKHKQVSYNKLKFTEKHLPHLRTDELVEDTEMFLTTQSKRIMVQNTKNQRGTYKLHAMWYDGNFSRRGY